MVSKSSVVESIVDTDEDTCEVPTKVAVYLQVDVTRAAAPQSTLTADFMVTNAFAYRWRGHAPITHSLLCAIRGDMTFQEFCQAACSTSSASSNFLSRTMDQHRRTEGARACELQCHASTSTGCQSDSSTRPRETEIGRAHV